MVSIWEKGSWYRNPDIVIAGGGLLGMWTAIELKKREPLLDVLVLERASRTRGASSRNAGFACFGSPGELLHDARTMGVEQMQRIVEMRYRGIRKIKKTFKANAIDFEQTGGHECFTHHFDTIRESLEELNSWLKPVVNHSETFREASSKMAELGLDFEGMTHTEAEAVLHSGKLVEQLYQLALEEGVRFFHGQEVVAWNGGKMPMVVTKDFEIKAKVLVVSTNAWLSEMVPDLHIKPARGQILLTRQIPGLMLDGAFHFDEGFYYWRNLHGRILFGGGRNSDFAGEETLSMTISEKIQNTLETFLQKHFTQVRHLPAEEWIEMRWSGIMAMTPDKQPLFKSVDENVFAACCCNGMGVSLTPVFGEMVAEGVLTSKIQPS